MRTLLIISQLIALCSCEVNTYEAHSVAGNYVKETNMQFGGTRSSSRSDGSSYANGYENSFRDGAQAVAVGIGAYQAVKINSSNNALTATENTNAANQAVKINQSDNALKAVQARWAAERELEALRIKAATP